MSTTTAAERVERILSVLPWIVDTPGVTIEQVCNRFALQERELRSDLDLLMYEVGIHPFTPDARVDVIVDDDRIFIHLGDYFRRPLRLTADEAVALYTAGRVLLGRPEPDQVLAAAVDKLERVLGADLADRIDVRLGGSDPEVLATVRAATDHGRRLSIDYYSFGRDQRSVREVDPIALVPSEGHWYLRAWCLQAGGLRRFRIDRITRAVATDEPVGTHPVLEATTEELDRGVADAPEVTLVLDRSAEWIIDTVPTEEVSDLGGGRIEVRLHVAATAWLQRLLLQLGPGVEARDSVTGEDLTPLGADAAARVLQRYA
ncbi:MAG: WYL domain-containing protein [Actinobacteria bacterium]|nr:WYL domain-containing protein [Actinomycetota bacterium]